MNYFKLDSEPKITSGFTTPDGYFESFSDKVLAKLPSEKEVKVLSLSKSRKPWYYAVAAAIVLGLSIPIYNRLVTNTQEIDSVSLENYLAYHPVSDDVIVDLLDQEDIDKMALELNVDDSAIEDALKSTSNLEEYLID